MFGVAGKVFGPCCSPVHCALCIVHTISTCLNQFQFYQINWPKLTHFHLFWCNFIQINPFRCNLFQYLFHFKTIQRNPTYSYSNLLPKNRKFEKRIHNSRASTEIQMFVDSFKFYPKSVPIASGCSMEFKSWLNEVFHIGIFAN